MTAAACRAASGLDALASGEGVALVRGRRVGLLCHAASVDRRYRHALDLLLGAGARVACLFGPEHGVHGAAQDMVGVSGERAPIPVHSLYGDGEESLAPRREQLDGLDAVVVDLADVGSRYYTYAWTALMMYEACARAGVEVVVLDRPNPLGGEAVEGPGVRPGYRSFVGYHPVPVRHGLTLAELLRLAGAEREIDGQLHVVRAPGWRRADTWREGGPPWVMPSPNMPSPETAEVYPGACLVEGTNLSEGRGTTRPFELGGAPWVDGARLARALEAEALPGVRFRPVAFQPAFHKHAGHLCGGVQIHVTDPRAFRPFLTGVALLRAHHRLWPERFAWRWRAYEFVRDRPAIDLLAGGPWLRHGVAAGAPLADLRAGWEAEEAAFRERRAPHLIYR